MKGFKYFTLLLIFILSSLNVYSDNLENPADNYLEGMNVSRNFAGDYSVRLKLKNISDKKYTLKDLGNNSFALMMPQVKSNIAEKDIDYENDHDDLKIIFSEKRDLTDSNNFYTKINFKTKKESIIKVEAFAPQNTKPPVVISKSSDEIEKAKDTYVPDWIWYIPIGILTVICILLMRRTKAPNQEPETKISGIAEIPVTERNSFFKSITPPDKTYSFEKFNPLEQKVQKENNISVKQDDTDNLENLQTLNSLIHKNTVINDTENRDFETDSIIDELVKIVIPKDDLILMPGVPELPGLDMTNKSAKNLYDTENIEQITLDEKQNLQEISPSTSISKQTEEETKENFIREADDIIFEERSMFFNSISPLPKIQKKEETQEEDNNVDYEKLIKAFQKILTIAHKVQDDNIPEPEIIDVFAIDDNKGFCLVKYGNKISLVGYLGEKVFLIKTFNPEEIKDDQLFMEFCTQTPMYSAYSVILNNFKALIRVTNIDISLIGEYD